MSKLNSEARSCGDAPCALCAGPAERGGAKTFRQCASVQGFQGGWKGNAGPWSIFAMCRTSSATLEHGAVNPEARALAEKRETKS